MTPTPFSHRRDAPFPGDEAFAANEPTRAKRLLFVGEAVTTAHVTRLIALADALPREHYDLHLACDPRMETTARLSPCRFHPLPAVRPEDFLRAVDRGRLPYDEATLSRYVEAEIALMRAVQPDVVVADFRPTLGISGKLFGVPVLSLASAYWSPYAVWRRYSVPEHPVTQIVGAAVGQFVFDMAFPLFRKAPARPLNAVRKSYGLPPVALDVREFHVFGDRALYADTPALVPTRNLPDTHHYLGPILWEPPLPLPPWWADLPNNKPIVFVGLGSSGAPGALAKILEGLSRLNVEVVVSTGSPGGAIALPENARAVTLLPAIRASARAAAVICNGGSPTAHVALAAGVPVLGIAHNIDQHMNMDALVRKGAGVKLRSGQLSPGMVAAAIVRMLEDGAYRDAARRLQADFRRFEAGPSLHQILWSKL